MPHNHEWQRRIKAVEMEFKVMRQAADRFLEQAKNDPTILHGDVSYGEIVKASRKLEGTYLIRLFAEFETATRQFWKTTKKTQPKTVDLLISLAAQRLMPAELLDSVQHVRDHRNRLVHEREENAASLPLATARKQLCTFLSFLPSEW